MLYCGLSNNQGKLPLLTGLLMTSKTQPAATDSLEQYADVIRLGWLIRQTEQRLLELFKQGKLFGTVHTCIGQEFVGIAVARVTGQ